MGILELKRALGQRNCWLAIAVTCFACSSGGPQARLVVSDGYAGEEGGPGPRNADGRGNPETADNRGEDDGGQDEFDLLHEVVSRCMPECDDGNPCTTDVCGPDRACHYEPVDDGTPCDDGNVCTADGQCIAGVCINGPALDCDDGDPCTEDWCHMQGGGCTHDPVTVAGSVCHDVAGVFSKTDFEMVPGEVQIFGQPVEDNVTVYAFLNGESDDTYTTANDNCGYESPTGWDIERRFVNESTYQLLVRGGSDSDCGKGQPSCAGTLEINIDRGWKIVEIAQCSAAQDGPQSNGVLIDTWCEVHEATGVITWQSGSGCGGCCACADGGTVHIDVTVVKAE